MPIPHTRNLAPGYPELSLLWLIFSPLISHSRPGNRHHRRQFRHFKCGITLQLTWNCAALASMSTMPLSCPGRTTLGTARRGLAGARRSGKKIASQTPSTRLLLSCKWLEEIAAQTLFKSRMAAREREKPGDNFDEQTAHSPTTPKKGW